MDPSLKPNSNSRPVEPINKSPSSSFDTFSIFKIQSLDYKKYSTTKQEGSQIT